MRFPFIRAFEERKWANGWNPTLVYPATEIIEEGTTFTTTGNGKGEKEFLWRVSKFDPAEFLIQYMVSTENRYWTITVQYKEMDVNRTAAEVSYTYIGLNEIGNTINENSIRAMYKDELKDWEEEINYYLLNGKIKSHE